MGLANESGADCYQNAVSQALASLDTLVAYLRDSLATAEQPAPTSRALLRLLQHLSGGSPESSLASVASMLGRSLLAYGQQQDAHEFLHVRFFLKKKTSQVHPLNPPLTQTPRKGAC